MIIVYKAHPTLPFSTLEIPNDQPCSASQIDGWVRGVNWYGSRAATPEAAIEEAIAKGFRG